MQIDKNGKEFWVDLDGRINYQVKIENSYYSYQNIIKNMKKYNPFDSKDFFAKRFEPDGTFTNDYVWFQTRDFMFESKNFIKLAKELNPEILV